VFNVWCDEYDAITEEQRQADTAKKANENFRHESSKPVIPDIELYKLKKMFSDIDFDGSGAVDANEIETHFNYMKKKREISEPEYKQLKKQFDKAGLEQNGCLSLNQFCMMMCPPAFRLPNTLGLGSRVIAAFLEFSSTSHDSHIRKVQSNFGQISANTEDALLPVVPEALLKEWQDAFNSIDTNRDGNVTVHELVESCVVSMEVGYSLVQMIDPDMAFHFTSEGFQNAMLKAHGYRNGVMGI